MKNAELYQKQIEFLAQVLNIEAAEIAARLQVRAAMAILLPAR